MRSALIISSLIVAVALTPLCYLHWQQYQNQLNARQLKQQLHHLKQKQQQILVKIHEANIFLLQHRHFLDRPMRINASSFHAFTPQQQRIEHNKKAIIIRLTLTPKALEQFIGSDWLVQHQFKPTLISIEQVAQQINVTLEGTQS